MIEQFDFLGDKRKASIAAIPVVAINLGALLLLPTFPCNKIRTGCLNYKSL